MPRVSEVQAEQRLPGLQLPPLHVIRTGSRGEFRAVWDLFVAGEGSIRKEEAAPLHLLTFGSTAR